MNPEISKKDLIEEISIVRGTFYGSIGVISRVGFLFLVNLFLARGLGVEFYGIWSLNFIILTFGNFLVLLGLEKGISRFIGQYRGSGKKQGINQIINSSIILVLLSSLTASILLFVFSSDIASFFKIEELSWMLKIIAFTFFPAALIEIIGSIFQGYENIKVSRAINSFIPSFLWLAAVGLLMVLGKVNLLNVSLSYLFLIWISGAVGVYFLFQFLKKESMKISLKSTLDSAKPLLSFSSPLLLFNFLTLVTVYIDSLIIGYFLGAYQVGIYQVAFRIARLSPFLLLGTADIFVPLISKNLAKKDFKKSSISQLYLRATKWAVVPTLLVVLSLMVFSDFFLSWFGQEFHT
jgi:O-antigen/teichoic acid export membrane protein